MEETTTWVKMGGTGETGETTMLGLGAVKVMMGTGGGGKKNGGGAMTGPATGDRRPGGGTGTVTIGGCGTSGGTGGGAGLLWASVLPPDTV